MRKKSSKLLLFYLNHPAQYHLFKNIINHFIDEGYRIKVVIVSKDILPALVKQERWDVTNICPEGRRHPKLPILLSALINLYKAEVRLSVFVWKHKPDILIGTEGTLAHVGFLFRKPSLLFNEDDTAATPENYIFYPFATKVIMPDTVDVGKWEKKKIIYAGNHELAYLHPRYFRPNREYIQSFNPELNKYFLVRLADLRASHDVGKKGLQDEYLRNVINILKPHGYIYISSEKPLKPEFEQYRIRINPMHIAHALYYADMFIGDSMTMSMEAAVLGTPSVRFNDFVGVSNVFNDLDNIYELSYGVKTSEPDKLIEIIKNLTEIPRLKEHWQEKRSRMLIEKYDVAEFFVKVIEDEVWKGEKIIG